MFGKVKEKLKWLFAPYERNRALYEHNLRYFFWEATLRCNLNCVHCGNTCHVKERSVRLSDNDVKAIFKDIAERYDSREITVAVLGGEPLMRRNLFSIMQTISNLRFSWGMSTNGTLVTKSVVRDCVKTGIKSVMLGVDGNEESHSLLSRNPQAFSKAIYAIKDFREAGVSVEVKTLVCPQTLPNLQYLYALLKTMNVAYWRLNLAKPTMDKSLLLNKDEFILLFNFVKSLDKTSLPLTEISEEGFFGYEIEKDIRSSNSYCAAGISMGGVLVDGSISACPCLGEEYIEGNISRISFTDAWEMRFEKFRNRTWLKTGECASCKLWKKCLGSSICYRNEKKEPIICYYKMLNK